MAVVARRSRPSSAARTRSSAPSCRRRRRARRRPRRRLRATAPFGFSRIRLPSAADGSFHSSRARFSDTIATGRMSYASVPGEIAAGDQRVAHRLQQPGETNLNRRIGGSCDLGVDLVLARRSDRASRCPVIGMTVRQADGRDAGNRRDLVHDRLLHPDDRLGLLHLRSRNRRLQRQDLLRAR